MKKTLIALGFLLSVQWLPAQKEAVIEQFHCFSNNGPMLIYLQDAEVKKTFLLQLGETLLQYRTIYLTDTADFKIDFLTRSTLSSPIKLNFTDADTNHLHLYIDLYEFRPDDFFTYIEPDTRDSALMQRAETVLSLNVWMVNSKKTIQLQEKLHIVVSAGETPGIGIPFMNLAAIPSGFTEILKKGMALLFDPQNNLRRVEMKTAPAFYADNFILPRTVGYPRTYVFTKKDISSYHYHDSLQLIRLDMALYQKIQILGKNPDKLPELITKAIENTENIVNSDYVFLLQEGRDVIRDNNYLLKLLVQVNPDRIPPNQNFIFTNFLPGRLHCLLQGKDTVAAFSIQRSVRAPDKKIYTNKVSNGFDSSSFFQLEPRLTVQNLIYDYVVNGNAGQYDFTIKCSGYSNSIKEIYLNGKLVCIAQGKFAPEKFVVFDASLPAELLNRLFIIGFNRFFE